jgi:hypothetical protein
MHRYAPEHGPDWVSAGVAAVEPAFAGWLVLARIMAPLAARRSFPGPTLIPTTGAIRAIAARLVVARVLFILFL